MGVALTADERWSFLESMHTGLLTTLRRDGSPVTLPVWFVVIERQIHLRTPAGTAKISRIRRDPRVSFVVETGKAWRDLKAVVVSGTAVIERHEDVRARIEAAFQHKYDSFTMPVATPSATRRHYGSERVYLRIDPTRDVLSWDNRKLRLREG